MPPPLHLRALGPQETLPRITSTETNRQDLNPGLFDCKAFGYHLGSQATEPGEGWQRTRVRGPAVPCRVPETPPMSPSGKYESGAEPEVDFMHRPTMTVTR